MIIIGTEKLSHHGHVKSRCARGYAYHPASLETPDFYESSVHSHLSLLHLSVLAAFGISTLINPYLLP